MWKTNKLYTAKLVAWAWTTLVDHACSVTSPKADVFEVSIGEETDALFVARPGDEMPAPPEAK